MQQTEKYKLNLIETSDPFSPAPLNENAEKTEAALADMQSALTAGTAALDQRVQVLELRRMAVGRFTSSEIPVELDFEPQLVIAVSNSRAAFSAFGHSTTYNGQDMITIKGNVIRCCSSMNSAFYLALS